MLVDSFHFDWIWEGLELLKVGPEANKMPINDTAYIFGLLFVWPLHMFKPPLTNFGAVPFKSPVH